MATPEQAQDAIAFVRALVADRDRDQAERTRILYGGSVKPDNAAELLALPDVDGALVGGASLDVADFAAIVEAARGVTRPVGLPRRPRRLGDRAARPRQRRLAGDDAGLRRPLAALSAQPAHDVGHGGRPARAPDGQLGGRPPQPRRRRGGQAGPHAHRRGRRGRDARRQRRPAGRRAGRAARAPHRPRLRRRRALRLEPPRGAHRDGVGGAPTTSSCTPSPTGATRCPTRAPASSSTCSSGASRPAARASGSRRRALLGDGSRQALGAHPEGLRHARARRVPSTTPTAASRRCAPPTSATRPTSSSSRRRSARRRASAPATRSSPSTSAPTACARSRARWPSRASTRSIAAASRGSSDTPP